MKRIKQFLKDWLGITDLEKVTVCQHRSIGRIEKKMRLGKKPMRYDEIERARKRRKKRAA